jgi:hypothetical protein
LSFTRRSSRSPFHSVLRATLVFFAVLLATKSSLALLKMPNHPRSPPPAIFAYTVITDDEADDMELQEETESVSTTEDTDNDILRGHSAVHPSSNFTATSVCPLSDSAASSVRPSPENTAAVGFKGGSEVCPPVNIFPTENVRPSTVPNNSVNHPGTSSEVYDEPDRPNVIPFDLDNDQEDTNLTNQDDATSSLDASAELMRWHIRLGHLPFANIRLMAARKEIPSRLANCRIPKCQSCLYGKATKRPWRTKGQSGTLKEVTLPGQCVSVDQPESPVAGFIGQNKEFFFRKRYKVATIFVDHFSRLSYVYLQESTKGVQTLAAKRSFEAYSASHGVKVQQYHADNGRFAEHLFLNHCEKLGQKVSLCGVSAHFQNGIAERRINDLTERSRASLLHAIHRWPSVLKVTVVWQLNQRYQK